MLTERELFREINRIGRESKSVEEALEVTQALLSAEIGRSVLRIDLVEQGISPACLETVLEFLDSREFPFKGLYTEALVVDSRKVGTLIACFGSFESPSELPQRITTHFAGRLGELFTRLPRLALKRQEAA